MAPRRQLYTIPGYRAFADALAKGLTDCFPALTDLARGIVLLPNNRAIKAVQDAFLRVSGDRGILLPRLIPIGDVDLDERLGAGLETMAASMPLPPVIDPLQRQLILARLVTDAEARNGRTVEASEAMRLAKALAATLDQLEAEEADVADLTQLDMVEGLQTHWRGALAMFEAVRARWPEELARTGCMDLAVRRNHILNAVSSGWRDHGSQARFICAAGINTAAPAVARLMDVVSRMPQGMIVFADLDIAMPAEEWDSLGVVRPCRQDDADEAVGGERPIETHPQFQLKRLLDQMSVHRDEVIVWPYETERDGPVARARLIGNAFAPPRFTARWQALSKSDRQLSGITGYIADTSAEEAQLIALALRETLEVPGKTAALVTPDRSLAERVGAHLKRWGIEADDSAGRSLSSLPQGVLPILLVEAADHGFAPVELLALLKHPLVRAGDGRVEWLGKVRQLDRLLRGPRPPAGLESLTRLVDATEDPPFMSWWREVATLLAPVEHLFANEAIDLASIADHVNVALTGLAGEAAWTGPAGRAVADLLADIALYGPQGPSSVTPDAVAPLLAGLMAGVAVYPPQGGHPRLFIWGLIEARLQRADRMILAGLNEGVWPSPPAPDPWLAPGIRRRLGLPGLESRIGLAAHDFAGAIAASEVILTRARRDAAGPAIASRFWQRLMAMTGSQPDAVRDGIDHRRLAAQLDATRRAHPAARPAPSPPLEARPRRIAITDVDRLKADPYAFYAKAVLQLRPLAAVDADPDAPWKGTEVHAILEQWSKQDDHAPEKLRQRARNLLKRPELHPVVRAMWGPRLLAGIDWIAGRMVEMEAEGRVPWLVEVKGGTTIGGVTLIGRADRIDRVTGGGLAIVDYKTGKPPSGKMVADGFAMQLGLVAAIAERGGFDVPGAPAQAFEYWSLGKSSGKDAGFGYIASPFGKPHYDPGEPAAFVAAAVRNFEAAASEWLTGIRPFTAKVRPEYANYADYDQLMRLEEWYARGTQEDTGA